MAASARRLRILITAEGPMRGRRVVTAVAIATAAATAATRSVRKRRVAAYPPGPDAITDDISREVAIELAALSRVGRDDRVLSFAPSLSTSVEPLLHGRHYFPRMLEAINGATTSVHLLIYGFQPGEIGTTFGDALTARAAAGVEVRLAVDAIGSQIDFHSKAMYGDLAAAGVTIVANDGLAPDRDGPLGSRRLDWHMDDFLHFDHRKMLIVDGRIAFVGGTGIEDHYTDERFYDSMVRVTGPVVGQLQALFVAAFRYQGGSLPTHDGALDHLFPEPDAGPLAARTTVLDNVPGEGHHPISDAIELALEEAAVRIDIVNPYISNRAILSRLLAAAQRGVPVRIVAPGKPTPPYPAAAFRHHYGRLLEAGVEILLHPQMAHAKVLRIDHRVFIGGCNLDDLSLFRNNELDLLFEDDGVAEMVEHEIFEPLVAMSVPATNPTASRERVWNAAMDRISRLL
jgi:cardiolipin synthase A/B